MSNVAKMGSRAAGNSAWVRDLPDTRRDGSVVTLTHPWLLPASSTTMRPQPDNGQPCYCVVCVPWRETSGC